MKIAKNIYYVFKAMNKTDIKYVLNHKCRYISNDSFMDGDTIENIGIKKARILDKCFGDIGVIDIFFYIIEGDSFVFTSEPEITEQGNVLVEMRVKNPICRDSFYLKKDFLKYITEEKNAKIAMEIE